MDSTFTRDWNTPSVAGLLQIYYPNRRARQLSSCLCYVSHLRCAMHVNVQQVVQRRQTSSNAHASLGITDPHVFCREASPCRSAGAGQIHQIANFQ